MSKGLFLRGRIEQDSQLQFKLFLKLKLELSLAKMKVTSFLELQKFVRGGKISKER